MSCILFVISHDCKYLIKFVTLQGLSLYMVSATSPTLERWQNDMFAAVDILSLLQKQVKEKAVEVRAITSSLCSLIAEHFYHLLLQFYQPEYCCHPAVRTSGGS